MYDSIDEQGFWNGNVVDMSDNLYYRIRLAEDVRIGIDAHLDPNGWQLQVQSTPAKDPYKSKLRFLLRDLRIDFEERQQDWRPFVHPERFKYDADLERIRPVLQNMIDKLATSQGRWE